MSQGLIEKMAEVDEEVAQKFRDGGLTDGDIKDLCFEALSEIITVPGMKGIVLRSRIWKIILSENTSEQAAPTTHKRKLDDIIIDDDVRLPLTPIATLKPRASATEEPSPWSTVKSFTPDSEGSSPWSESFPVATRPSTSQAKSPAYTIYIDRDISLGVKAGHLPKELKQKIVRGTIHNMISVSYNKPWNRMPSSVELEEMAKSLVLTYPLLNDPKVKHGVLLKQLRKRMYNMKPVEKKRGPIKRKRLSMETPENKECEKPKVVDSESEENKENEGLDSPVCDNNSESSESYNIKVMERHYNALANEMSKSKPCGMKINLYLNKEFDERRRKISEMPIGKRHEQLFDEYPCFKNHVEIVEEVRRIKDNSESTVPDSFMKNCVARIDAELDYLIYYGVAKGNIGHPSTPNITTKVIHVLQNLQQIFVGKTTGKSGKHGKKPMDLTYVLKDHEDPKLWCKKQHGNSPKLLIDGTMTYIVCSGHILCTIPLNKIKEAVLAFIGSFYLLDIDYPKSHELGLTVLHSLLFEDESCPEDLLATFNTAVESYRAYKH